MKTWNKENPRPKDSARIIGIDGEGQGRSPHIYNFLAAADEYGKVWELGHGPSVRLTTEECLWFLLELPRHSLVFAYAFLYDLTKILTDLPKVDRHLLFHEKKRQYISRVNGRPVVLLKPRKWGPFSLNYQNRKFTVSSGNRSVTVWDIFAFFQSKFTKACIDWKVGDAASIAAMEEMKEKRSTFDSQSWDEVRNYCKTECLHLAQLGRSLLNAHEDAGFPLEEYYGAGSTAKALMNKHNVRDFIGEIPDAMREAVACAFFGGRFEQARAGIIRRKVWNADINSAYPYAATSLPCLIHGRWKCTVRNLDAAIENSSLALIQWSLPRPSGALSDTSWGVLPVRKLDGSIAFPLGASSGWAWKSEFLAARRLRPDVIALCIWHYSTDCQCRPFSFLPDVYLERLRLGPDARGIPLKLGPNSIYGKTVQSVGFRPPFQAFVWGGNITSSCRAQVLELAAKLPSLDNLLAVATDGVWTDVDCKPLLPKPRDTGTNHATGKGALGAWTTKDYPKGLFLARPGIYFPLNPTDKDLEQVRARGLGRRVLYERHASVVTAWSRLGNLNAPDFAAWAEANEEAAEEFGVTVPGGQRFVGIKSAVRNSGRGVVVDAKYGEWVDWEVDVSFDPRPKRCGMVPSEFPGETRLLAHPYFDAPSLPYDPAMKTEETKLIEVAQMMAEEQPNGDFTEGWDE